MVGNNNENILVEFDYQNIVLVDPNKTIDNLGNVKERLLHPEDLVFYANLECTLFPRTRLAVSPSGNIDNKTISIASINFLKPNNKSFLSEDFYDDITALNKLAGLSKQTKGGINSYVESKYSLNKSENTGTQPTQDSNRIDTDLLGITQITVDTNLNLFPEVTIEMEDVRGRALFEKGENSPYSVFFNYPYPLFYLTIKGYLGKAIKYQLALRTFNARFDTGSGNFKITVKFYAYKFNVLSQLTMKYLMAVPYMYTKKYTQTNPANPNQTAAAISAGGSGTSNVQVQTITKGYQKIREVYSEYKNKGLIDSDFPEITLPQLIKRLEQLESLISNLFKKADLQPITDGNNYQNDIIEYEKEIYYFTDSWFKKYMDTNNFLVELNTNKKVYTFNDEVVKNGKVDVAIDELKGLITKNNKKLFDNLTFGGNDIKTKVGDIVVSTSIPNPIKYETFTTNVAVNGIDWAQTWTQRTGQQPNNSEQYNNFVSTASTRLSNSVIVNNNNEKKYYWFYFDELGGFLKLAQDMNNQLSKKLEEIQKKLAEILSTNLQSKNGGLGFKPTIKNIIAVLLASAEAFLRLMDEVHLKAWDQQKAPDRVKVILSTDKSAPGVDTKNSVQTNNGNLIPVYPWPQYFVETGNEKGEKFELTYPGDPKVVNITKGFRYDIWPEIEFVEEYFNGITKIKTDDPGGNLFENQAQIINRVSLASLDFPLSNILYSNKQEAKFLYEIWERVFINTYYQRYYRNGSKDNQIQDVIAEAEFLNIKNALSNDSPYLIQKLKQYGLTSTNIVPFLAQISNNGLGESWQKHIRDEFATGYIQQEINNSFAILDSGYITPGVNVVKEQPENIDKLKTYLTKTASNETDFTDTFPFNSSTWYRNNLANSKTTNKFDSYNTSKVYVLNTDKKLIANFDTGTSAKEKRPITNFNFYNINTPSYTGGLKDFYTNRTNDTQLPTEGNVVYDTYVGNISNKQTTSMLNTPYFVNSIQEGVTNWLTGNTYPYVSSSFLFLHSLPLATLRERYKTYEGSNATDLDFMFATFRKFGGLHKVPYAWVLKYGAIWHRYKVWIESNTDILQNVWTDFKAVNNFDPVTLTSSKTYTLTVNGSVQKIALQKTDISGTDTIVNMNVGFYPKLINDYNLFYRGYDLFVSGYTDSEIQSVIDSPSGVTLTLNNDSNCIINKDKGYDTTNPNQYLNLKPWSCLIKDSVNKKDYIVPSFGCNINQVNGECFDNTGKLLQSVASNPAVFNGSVRSFWSLPNYGYFDTTNLVVPTPFEYMKQIITDNSQQESFSIRGSSAYTTNEEILSIFNKDIMDLMENEFLKFSKSMYEYETQQVGDYITTRVQVNKLYVDANSSYRNFQLLMKEMMSMPQTSGQTSSGFVDNVQNAQLSNLTSTLQKFLEFDVVLKYGNPSNYNRKLFDSYSTVNVVEDKISYAPYVVNSLPTSGGTTTLAASIAAYPETWKNLYKYVGFSTQSRLKYTDSGSTITDFFVDMNIEFIPDSVVELAPLIRIYATQKRLDPTLNRTKFVGLLNTYLNENKSFNDLALNSLFNKLNTKLPNVTEVVERNTQTAIEGQQQKVTMWESFKALNDTWIAGYDYSQTTFLEDVMFMDRANRNVGDDFLIDPFQVRNLLSSKLNEGASVYFYLESILDVHHFVCMMHPGYINFYNVQEVQKNSVPKVEGTLEFGNTLFGTYLNVDTRNASPKLVCMYAAEPSKHPNMGKNENYKFNDDSFDLSRTGDMPLTDKLQGKTDWGLSNKVVGFNVDIGITNQNMFYRFDVSQDLGKETSESLAQMDRMINQYNGKSVATQNVSLWNFYKNRSYQCRVTSLGNAMIQPTMYFNLRHVPMFSGPYQILDVKHTITPGKFETNFTGIRQQIFALPKLDSYIQTLTQNLIQKITEKLKKDTVTNVKVDATTATTTSNNVTNTNNAFVTNSNVVNNSDNCNLYTDYSRFVPNTGTQTQSSLQLIADGINTNVNSGGPRVRNTRYLSFVTIYLESFTGSQFVCFNNNYAGVKLNYKWAGSLSTKFDQQYTCLGQSNGQSAPYAVFSNVTNLYQLLDGKWGPLSGKFDINPESITKAWITSWNKKTMSDSDYNKLKTTNKDFYNNVLAQVESAISLASTLGI